MARRQKTSADTPGEGQQGKDKDKDSEKAADKSDKTALPPNAADKSDKAALLPNAADKSDKAALVPNEHDAKTQPIAARRDSDELPAIEPPTPHDEPWPDATPAPMKPVEAPGKTAVAEVATARAPTETVAMAPLVDLGKPPEMPQSSAPRPLALGDVENPAHMPGPKDIPAGDPDDPAPAPGLTPPGDSRSFRRGNQFALVYRVGTCVISRTGVVGRRGQWRVVEYPTSASASSSYAHECSRFVSEGFSDYRD